jgi:hypothetical protein
LFDNGQQLDEYNSCPDYFGEPSYHPSLLPRRGPSGGNPDLLLRYCRPGVKRDALIAILAADAVFADDVVTGLAQAIGIEPERALVGYSHVVGARADIGTLDEVAGERNVFRVPPEPPVVPAPPSVRALVEAARAGNTEEIARLLAERVPVDAEATIPLPRPAAKALAGKYFSGEGPEVRMSPLIAAVVHDQTSSARRLLERGANPNQIHPKYGTPLNHCAAMGKPDLMQVLLERGADVTVRNALGQTPLQVAQASLASVPATLELIARAKEMIQSTGSGANIPGYVESIENFTLPVEGWQACARLLMARGG